MKSILKIAALFVVAIPLSLSLKAQRGEVKMYLNYNYSLPLGSFKNDIVSKNSPRGFTGDILYSFNKKFALGGAVGFQDYYEKYPRATYKLPSGEDISAVISNSVQTIPVMVKGLYAPLGDKFSWVQPYVSLGAGINMVSFKQYLGEFGSSNTNVSFAAQAGAGIQVPFGRLSNSGLQLGAVYNYVPYTKNGYNNLNNLGVQLGVHFPLR
ncbi:outer membrane beta-barrel protein [Foetidibacter luteolus]|uniref:outer membrane beta-barrel protein n=1 Tax=Foetidibacter luteolus TaxID=2608880 RepID=UPI00129A999B|nr:outer membrane beta-barrel protein [Foetidibacter luteolus]